MAKSPRINGSGLVDLIISCNGNKMEESRKIISLTVTKKINHVPQARIVLLDGDIGDGDFPVSNSDEFTPGSEIVIAAGYEHQAETIFEGIVIRHGIRIDGDGQARLIVDCRDKSVKMTIGRKNANYVAQKDHEIITGLIQTYDGLSLDVKDTSITYKELVQYYCTDWDFMLSRAEANGMLVIVDDGKVSVTPPKTDSVPGLKVSYGSDIISFDAHMDARTQVAKVMGTTWEPSSQTAVQQEGSPPALNAQGDLEATDLAKVIGLDTYMIQTAAPVDKIGLKAWADAHMLRAGLARIQGKIKFQGSAKAKPGSLMTLERLGNRFNGDVFISSAVHTFTPGNWITEVEFGLAPDGFSQKTDILAPPAAGFLPGIEGLQIGIVKQLSDDPEKEHKVQVTIPLMKNETQGVWARIAKFYGSNGFGAYFMPEIGDEVVLGYFNNDPCHPVILGSLYSSKNPPPYTLEDDNNFKAIVTRSELTLEFDDDKKIITLLTPGGNKMIFSDDDKSISIMDQNSNKIILGTDGIEIKSPKDIKISAQGKIQMDGAMGVDISSDMDIKQEGLNINCTAKVGLTAKGNASAELSASGQTTVKGSMVMIN
jgi:Rhs element Vgr protein